MGVDILIFYNGPMLKIYRIDNLINAKPSNIIIELVKPQGNIDKNPKRQEAAGLL